MIIISVVFFLIWLLFFTRVKSIDKNGIKIYATVANVIEEEKRSEDGYFVNKYYWYECEFNYNGIHRKKISFPLKLGDNIKSVGEKVECIYIPNEDILMLKETQDYNNKGIYHILLIPALLPVVYFIFNVLNIDLLNFFSMGYLVAILFIIVGIVIIKRGIISKDSIQVNAVIKDIFITRPGRKKGKFTYGPVFEFYYNGKSIVQKSSFSSGSNKYNNRNKIGDNIIVYYDIKTGKCITKDSVGHIKLFGIVFIIIGVLIIVFNSF